MLMAVSGQWHSYSIQKEISNNDLKKIITYFNNVYYVGVYNIYVSIQIHNSSI